MAIKISKEDVKWSYLSLFLLNGINVLLLPFILTFLSASEIGLWYTFTAISGLVLILDFGFMTTLSRNITFIWAGSNQIVTEGFKKNVNMNGKPNFLLFSKVFKVTKRFYTILSLIIFFILLSVGTIYIYYVTVDVLEIKFVLISWFFYIMSVFLNIKYAYWNAILRGIGAIKENQKIIIVSKITQFFFSIIMLLLGFGIVGISVAYLISVIVNRVLAHIAFFNYQNNKEDLRGNFKKNYDNEELKNIFKIMLPNAYKQGMISISNFINQRSLTLVSSAFLGLSITGSLGLVIQVITLINTLANTFFNTYLSQFSAYRINEQCNELKNKLFEALFKNYLIVLIGYTLFYLIGPIALDLIGSNTELLPMKYMMVLYIYMFLYNNHMLFSTFLATANILPHYKAFFTSSILILITQITMFSIGYLNLWSLLLPLLFINLLYNNWKWPYEVLIDLNISVIELLKGVIKQVYRFRFRTKVN